MFAQLTIRKRPFAWKDILYYTFPRSYAAKNRRLLLPEVTDQYARRLDPYCRACGGQLGRGHRDAHVWLTGAGNRLKVNDRDIE